MYDIADVGQRLTKAHIHLISTAGTRLTFEALAERVSAAHGERVFTGAPTPLTGRVALVQ